MKHVYPERKTRELAEEEKQTIRTRIHAGELDKEDTYRLAREFGCASSQVAGIKAAMKRK